MSPNDLPTHLVELADVVQGMQGLHLNLQRQQHTLLRPCGPRLLLLLGQLGLRLPLHLQQPLP
jgi:hypothetical protein